MNWKQKPVHHYQDCLVSRLFRTPQYYLITCVTEKLSLNCTLLMYFSGDNASMIKHEHGIQLNVKSIQDFRIFELVLLIFVSPPVIWKFKLWAFETSYPAGIYLFIANNGNTKIIFQICLKSMITLKRREWPSFWCL